jgi:hypothetical protein
VVFADLLPVTTGEHGEAPCHVRGSADAHCAHVRALQRSPAFDDVIMTVGDWTFKLWKEGTGRPIFESKCADAYLTAALWSPSRPAVIYLGLQVTRSALSSCCVCVHVKVTISELKCSNTH